MARNAFNAKLQVASSSSAVATASTAGIGDLTIDSSRTVTEIASRGINQKRALVGLASCVITGSAEADAAGLTVMQTANRSGTDVYAKLTWADGSSISGQFVVSKCSSDDPVDGEERWDFELQPSATASADSDGNVITYTAASSD